MSEARIEELEMKLSFQENALQTMSDEMAKQQLRIETLASEVDRLHKALQAASAAPAGSPVDEPPPPHY